MEKLKCNLIKLAKNKTLKEGILYLIFGVLTTIVNYVSFYLFYKVLFNANHELIANLIAFILAVAFAFVTNKYIVFEKTDKSNSLKEKYLFVGTRIGTFLFEQLGLYLTKVLLNSEKVIFTSGKFELDIMMTSKIILSIIVTIINYFLAKFIVFKKGK